MRFFLYCIVRNKDVRLPQLSCGIKEGPLTVVAMNQLAAVVSAIDASETRLDLNDALAHHKVIVSFHKRHTVIPIRFGTLFDDPAEIGRLLECRQNRYRALLEHLDGCVELGIKIILSQPHPETTCDPLAAETSETLGDEPDVCGTAYLCRRKTYYSQEDLLSECTERIVQDYRQSFAGLFREIRVETLKKGRVPQHESTGLLSLYFLVPQTSLPVFQEIFQVIKSQETSKILLTGPWPPYNFVSSEADTSEEMVTRHK